MVVLNLFCILFLSKSRIITSVNENLYAFIQNSFELGLIAVSNNGVALPYIRKSGLNLKVAKSLKASSENVLF